MNKHNAYRTTVGGSADLDFVVSALRRGASRREILGWLLAGGMGVAAGGSILGIAGQALADIPKTGGRIRVAGNSSSTADTVDPAKQSLSTDYSRCFMFYNGLTSLDEKLSPQLELAEAIETEKATIWTIKLRQGITFHDGAPLTAADVVYSLARHKDPAVGSKAKSLADQMTGIKATGKHEVTITLAGPNADLPVILGTPHFLIVKEGTADFSTAVGTGPYRCKEFAPGIRSVGVRNENYWKPGKPYLDEIELFGIPDGSARVNALLSGDIHAAALIAPRQTRQIKDTPGFSVFETRSGAYNDLIMRQDVDPSRNHDLVMALKLLQDRKQMQAVVYQGYAVLGNDQPVDPTNRFYDESLPQRAYDPEKAKFHLRKSGYENTPIPLYAMTGTPLVDLALLLQQSGQKIGLNLDLKKMPADGYWSNVWMKHPLTLGSINPRPSADVMLTLFFKSDAPWNESGWKNQRFDELLGLARAETDGAKRKAMYGEMQHLVHERCGIGIPLFNSLLDGHTDKLKGLKPIPTGSLMGYNFAENVWLDA